MQVAPACGNRRGPVTCTVVQLWGGQKWPPLLIHSPTRAVTHLMITITTSFHLLLGRRGLVGATGPSFPQAALDPCGDRSAALTGLECRSALTCRW